MVNDYARKRSLKPEQPSSSLTIPLTLLIGVLVFVAILAVVLINKAAESGTVDTEEYQQTQQNIEQEEVKQFSYGELLANAEVAPEPVEAYQSTPKDPTKKYNKLLKVASVKSSKSAEQLAAALKKKELPNVTIKQDQGSSWIYVTVGPFSNRSMLNKAQDILASMGYVPQVLSVKAN